jgi:putative ABC transport system permease protein
MNIGMLWRRLRQIAARDRVASELAEEMRLHVELRAQQLQSRDEARRRFGNLGAVLDASAGVWRWNACERALQELRHAVRSLRQSPGFTAIVVGTLGLGLGMNTAVFSLLDGVMLHRLPYRDAGRLVSLWEEQTREMPEDFSTHGSELGGSGGGRTTLSVANLADYRKAKAIEDLATFDLQPMNVIGLGTPERLAGEAVSANFFTVLGVEPMLGRSFTAADDREGAPRVVVLTYGFWQQKLGGDTGVLARSVTLDERPYQVIGVLPRGFESPFQMTEHERIQFYVPAAYPRAQLASRGDHDVNGVARLRPGVSLPAAQKELDAISASLASRYPTTNRNIRASIGPLRDDLVRNVRTSLWILAGASGLIVLIMCVNVANLLLVRAIGRRHESSVRMAMGAGRGGLVRQFLTESLVLAAAGCVAGLAAGTLLIRVLVALAPQDTPRIMRSTWIGVCFWRRLQLRR